MTKQLPPVSHKKIPPVGPGIEPPDNGNGIPGVSKVHPFDVPFDIIKSLQLELQQLRTAFRQEQQKNESEVAKLKEDLLQLKNTLTKEERERTSACQNLKAALNAESERRETTLQQFQSETVAQLQKRAMLNDHTQLKKRVDSLEELLDTESKEWRNNSKALSKQIEQNTEGDNDFARQVVQQLQDHKRLIDEHSLRDVSTCGHINLRIQAAADILMHAGSGKSPASPSHGPSGGSVGATPQTTAGPTHDYAKAGPGGPAVTFNNWTV